MPLNWNKRMRGKEMRKFHGKLDIFEICNGTFLLTKYISIRILASGKLNHEKSAPWMFLSEASDGGIPVNS